MDTVPEGLPVGMRIGCRGHVLAMNPDPSQRTRAHEAVDLTF